MFLCCSPSAGDFSVVHFFGVFCCSVQEFSVVDSRGYPFPVTVINFRGFLVVHFRGYPLSVMGATDVQFRGFLFFFSVSLSAERQACFSSISATL